MLLSMSVIVLISGVVIVLVTVPSHLHHLSKRAHTLEPPCLHASDYVDSCEASLRMDVE